MENPEVVVRRVIDLDTVKVEPTKLNKIEAVVHEVTIISHTNNRYLVFGTGILINAPDGDNVAEDGLTEKRAKAKVQFFFGKEAKIESWAAIIKAADAGTKVKLHLVDGVVRVQV